MTKKMKRIAFYLLVAAVLGACSGKSARQQTSGDEATADSAVSISVKYATGFSVRDSLGMRLVDIGKKDHFALVGTDDARVPDGYTKVRVPIKSTICMTALQLSNFTVLVSKLHILPFGISFIVVRLMSGVGVYRP